MFLLSERYCCDRACAISLAKYSAYSDLLFSEPLGNCFSMPSGFEVKRRREEQDENNGSSSAPTRNTRIKNVSPTFTSFAIWDSV